MKNPFETFNPASSKYEKVSDLPKKEQKNFTDVEGGFVKTEAFNEDSLASIAASFKLEEIIKQKGERPLDVDNEQNKIKTSFLENEAKKYDKERDIIIENLDKWESGEIKNTFGNHCFVSSIIWERFDKLDISAEKPLLKRIFSVEPGIAFSRMTPKEIFSDKEIILSILNSENSVGIHNFDKLYDNVPDNFKNDREIVIALAKYHDGLLIRRIVEDDKIKKFFCNDSELGSLIMNDGGKEYFNDFAGDVLKEKVNKILKDNNPESPI
jgi:hypothetical protein